MFFVNPITAWDTGHEFFILCVCVCVEFSKAWA